MNITPTATLWFVLAAALLALHGCSDAGADVPEGATEGCSVLSSVQASAMGSISGNAEIGPFDSYGINASGSSDVAITPPADTPCAREIASRLQGLCAVCEQSSDQACEAAVERTFDIAQTPIAACAACGDGVCSDGESAVMNDGDNTFCPEDCNRSQCGDGVCQGRENKDCPAGSTEETCVACPEDCGNTCGDGVCRGTERDVCPAGSTEDTCVSCPIDCDTACGDGDCNGTESANPEDEGYCPQDCRSLCGNGICQPDESAGSCPEDCQECGDLICSDPDSGGNETTNTCPIDCDICGDDFCGRSEVLDEEDADPDNEEPLRRTTACSRDCWVRNDGVCSPGEPPEEIDCQ